MCMTFYTDSVERLDILMVLSVLRETTLWCRRNEDSMALEWAVLIRVWS